VLVTNITGISKEYINFMKSMNFEKFLIMETIEYFKECCDCGGFIDSDGFGVYATETQVSSIDVNPSDIETGLYRKDFTHVVWFNK
jgi:hypothetical protein